MAQSETMFSKHVKDENTVFDVKVKSEPLDTIDMLTGKNNHYKLILENHYCSVKDKIIVRFTITKKQNTTVSNFI